MRIIKILLILIITPISFSCIDSNNYSWKIYSGEKTKLNLKYESFNKLLIKDDTIYLLGTRDKTLDLADNVSIVCQSVDNGKSWIEIFKNNGSIINGYLSADDLYLFKEIYTDNSLENTSITLLNSNKLDSIHSFKKNSYIKDVFIDDLGKGVLILNNSFSSVDNSVFKTGNDFKTYDSLYVNKAISKSFYYKNKTYLLTYVLTRKNYKINETNIIYTIDKNNKRDSINLKFNAIDFMVDNKEDIWTLGKENNYVVLKHLNKKEVISTSIISKDKNLNPKKLYKYNQFIAVLSNSIDESALGGFGGTKYTLHLSYNSGKSFEIEKIPIDNYVDPISFFKDEKIVIYSGVGRISVCDLKERVKK